MQGENKFIMNIFHRVVKGLIIEISFLSYISSILEFCVLVGGTISRTADNDQISVGTGLHLSQNSEPQGAFLLVAVDIQTAKLFYNSLCP